MREIQMWDGHAMMFDYAKGFAEGVVMGLTSEGAYTHRNGETDPPTQYGYYWIEFPLDYLHYGGKPYYRMHFLGHRYSDNQLEWDDGDFEPVEGCKFYGPIPQP